MSLYIVQPGDTMYSIASMFGVQLADLVKANPQIKDPNTLYPGQTIHIPGAGQPSPPSHFYVVQAGDTMYSIAAQYGLTLAQLQKANPQLKDPNTIYPGQVIYIS